MATSGGPNDRQKTEAANHEKDLVISRLGSDLVLASCQVQERDEMLNEIFRIAGKLNVFGKASLENAVDT